ncbi:MAG: cation:proton antiporter [Tannerella sp.]|jgi:CPA2 family monovalent cation:H+ antiporter-2|nr:cation:proton antiporter [Tannerella sp.]
MGHLPDFIQDLAIILISAGIFTILFKWLKQPVVLGYILAGFMAGPHLEELLGKIIYEIFGSRGDPIIHYFEKLPSVTDMANISTWAEIGVIFLLFALGLEFSFKKLLNVGGTASIATLINMGSMIVIGYGLGRLLGWGDMDSIFLGGMLSMSSTTIIIKAFSDMGLQKTKFANIVFGMLIVEDLAAIIMMVLLSTIAVSQHVEGGELVMGIFKLLFFIFIWFVVGIYLIPTLFKKLNKYLNDEMLLIISAGMCLGMVLFASSVGFSAALGAFIMGSILAETIESKHIEHLIEPLKNFFGAVFFVSVGMMIDPLVIWEYGGIVILMTAVVLIGRVVFASLGVIAAGQGLKVAIQSGFSLAQIGEFSFIIATLGMSLGVISDILYPIIVAVSVITTFTTPYFIKMSPAVSGYIEKHIPPKWNKLIYGYASSDFKSVNKQNDWRKLLKNILFQVSVYFTLSFAIMLICKTVIIPLITDYIPDVWGAVLSAIITLIAMAPFMRAMIMKKNRSLEFKNLWNDSHFNRGALISLIVLRIALAVMLVSMVLFPLFSTANTLLLLIAFAVTISMILSQGLKKQSRKIEDHFLKNLTRKQRYEDKKAAIPSTVTNDMKSRDIHIEEYEISPNSSIIGKTLLELQFKQRTGVSVISILRGNRKINIPDPNEHIYPYDKLVVSGCDEELQKLTASIENRKAANSYEEVPQHHVCLSQFVIENDSPLIGKSIKESKIREKTETLIIGIERDNDSIINFSSDFVFQENDVLLLAGEMEKLNVFDKNIGTEGSNASSDHMPGGPFVP